MDVERLIELAGRKQLFPVRRVTYARVLAECPLSKTEMLDMLARVRSPDATAAGMRTLLRRLMQALPWAGLHRGRLAQGQSPEIGCWTFSRVKRRKMTSASAVPSRSAMHTVFVA
jgi:hypothetical protein